MRRDGPGTRLADALSVTAPNSRGPVTATNTAAPSGWLSSSAVHELAEQLEIPVPSWQLASTRDEAAAVASRIGFPVALKADSGEVVHKSDTGGVALNLGDPEQVREAYDRVQSAVGRTDGRVLVQAMAPAGVEVIVGLFRDETFGPVVMVGSGGRATELAGDSTFRVCPIDTVQALDMLRATRCYPLLTGYRGGPQMDVEALAELLVRIVSAADADLDGEQIVELEINPLIMTGSGMHAVDIRVRSTALKDEQLPRKPVPDLTPLFRPSSVAFIGASRRATLPNKLLSHMVTYGYQGPLYPINSAAAGDEIHGLEVLRSVEDLPQPVDYAVVAVPAQAVPQTLRASAGRMRFAHVVTSGFGETGPSGKALEAQILEAARDSGIRLLGPNCLGLHSAEARLTFVDGMEPGPGNVSVISHSGGLGADILRQGQARGIRFGKLVTVGNAVDLSPEDLLEYFCTDPGTEAIGLYLEGTRDGRRLAMLLDEASRVGKPVVILRGGRSLRGAQAASSHTGALAGEERLWAAMAAQTGCIYASSLTDFLSALAAAGRLRPTEGGRVLLVGPSGGMSVLASDHCSRIGLTIPELSNETQERMQELSLPPGMSLRNPIDTPAGALALEAGALMARLIRTAIQNESFDYIVIHLNVQNLHSYTDIGPQILRHISDAAYELHEQFRSRAQDATQIVLCLCGNGEPAVARLCRELAAPLWDRGLAVFFDLASALDGIGAVTQIGRHRTKRGWGRPGEQPDG